jgi:hypothetical protein
MYPWLKIHDAYMPLDLGFALEKAGRGLFWAGLKGCDSSKRGQILTE